MTISEIQERVTKAILPAFDHIPDPEYRQTIAGCWARAAMEAMLEPTGEQVHAATLTAVRENGGMEIGIAGMWRAMVKEALNPNLK